jgi:hypothetical protein
LKTIFTHVKEKLTLHRGLRLWAKKNFIKWYLYFKIPAYEFFLAIQNNDSKRKGTNKAPFTIVYSSILLLASFSPALLASPSD